MVVGNPQKLLIGFWLTIWTLQTQIDVACYILNHTQKNSLYFILLKKMSSINSHAQDLGDICDESLINKSE